MTKRPVMGKAATEYGDYIIVTSDNPRNENPQNIITDILNGISLQHKSKCHIELDRKQAIKKALDRAQPHSIVAILGKGHETGHIVGDDVFYLSDYDEVIKLK